MSSNHTHPKIAFFGTPDFAVIILDELKNLGFIPSIVITAPDKPKGRHLLMTPPPVKIWAKKNNVPVLQPEKLDDTFLHKLSTESYDLFVVAAYGIIIPLKILKLPKSGTLNVHPSLLPKYRGSSPVESVILAGDKETGVTIMKLDDQMDHGHIVAVEKISLSGEEKSGELENLLAHSGGTLLAQTIPLFISGDIIPIEQNHTQATFTKKIKKEDGLLDLDDDQEKNYRKFLAYDVWPGTYFFFDVGDKKIRVIIKDADFTDGKFVIKKVLPEGKKEMTYDDFLRGHQK
ncbi:MAG: methionyl-tRNA formyltransferase [Candidatus Paceibacterota bacterium]|jgi:methionyl-tRNA formyltransferase